MKGEFSQELRERVAFAIRHNSYPDGMPLRMFEDMLDSKPEDAFMEVPPKPTEELLRWWKQYTEARP